MSKTLGATLLLGLVLSLAGTQAAGETSTAFSRHVDGQGNINLPADVRATWSHLGTWLLTATVPAATESVKTTPGPGVHNVYTEPHSLRAYLETGRWPDGATLAMEVRTLRWDDLPTGHVIGEGTPTAWFIMVKDATGRFAGNPHWGDGWGWALFQPGASTTNASSDYRKDCRGCHEAAMATDWVFGQGLRPGT